MDKGFFITIEGIEGVGKSTQIELLCSYLKSKNIKHISTREPGGLSVPEAIRAILLHQEMHPLTELMLYEAARAEHFQKIIKPAINSGITVVCDRFTDSSLSYQGYGRGLDLELIYELNAIATQNTSPDISFVLDMSVEKAFERLKSRGSKADRFESLSHDFYEKVRKGYRDLSKKEPKRLIIIDAQRGLEEVHSDIVREFENRILHLQTNNIKG
jgi:dTMP kinase